MKLNPDCVRDILLTVEENISDIQSLITLPDSSFEHLKKYTDAEIIYHARQCSLSGLLIGSGSLGSDYYRISDLSPRGHEFLANIREESIWRKTNAIAKSIGCSSLASLSQIAAGVIQAFIQAHLNL